MIGKRIAIGLVSGLLVAAASTWVLTSALHSTIGTADKTKVLLHESGIYQAIIPDQIVKAQQNSASWAQALANPQIQKLLAGTVSQQKVTQQGDKAVDSIYNWLEGKTTTPDISIEAAPDNSSIKNAVSNFTSQLPTCAAGESPGANIASNPLSARCIPAGISPSMITDYISSTIAANPQLANGIQLTEQDLKVDHNQTIGDAYNWAPALYQQSQSLPLISMVVGVICIALLLLLLELRGGLRAAGKQLLIIGVVFALGAAAVVWALKKVLTALIPGGESTTLVSSLGKLITLFSDALRGNIIRFGIYLAIFGALLWIISIILSRLQAKKSMTPSAPQTTRV